MNCPQCGQNMKKDLWIAGTPFGNIISLGVLFWLLFLFVFLTGGYGFAAVVLILAWVIALNWGRFWYSCPHCGYSVFGDG
jgi:hypothetical protein